MAKALQPTLPAVDRVTPSDRFAAFRACGCTGDPTGYEPPTRHPDCRAHAFHPDDPETCPDCGDCGEVPAAIAPGGLCYVQACVQCSGAPKRRFRQSVAEIASQAPSRPNRPKSDHEWKADGFGARWSEREAL